MYIKLKIPFATKSFIKKSYKGLKIKGNAYYIFDLTKQVYIDEYLEIEKANFRLTDKNMLKTKYYQSKVFKNFRKEFLDCLSNKNPESIQELTHQDLDETNIEKINNQFMKMNVTNRNMYACLSGSNPSGAEFNNKNAPLICTDPNYFKCNFLNPLKLFAAKTKDKRKIENVNIPTVKLNEFLDKINICNIKTNQTFKELFWKYNDINKDNIEFSSLISDSNEKELEITNLQLDKNCFHDKKFKEKNKDFELFIEGYLKHTLSDSMEWTLFKNKLRNFYNWNVQFCIKNNYLASRSTIKCFSQNVLENAHIISFSDLVATQFKENILKAIDPYNCLRIDSNCHKMFDDKQYYFDLKGDLVDLNNNRTSYLNMKYLSPKQINYLKESLKTNK